jgi:hypothetical protein
LNGAPLSPGRAVSAFRAQAIKVQAIKVQAITVQAIRA